MMWLVVEGALSQAISLESDVVAIGHNHGDSHEGGEIVTRLEQQIGGTVTVLLVAALVGLAFAVVYTKLRDRLPGASDLGKSLALGALAFTGLVAVPAVLVPANPPGVGDPETVNIRTLIYLGVIALAVVAIGAVFTINRALAERGLSPETRWIATAGAAIFIFGAILMFGPNVYPNIPETMPASIIWKFRVGSLGQLAAMWLLIGLVHGYLQQRHMSRFGTAHRSLANA